MDRQSTAGGGMEEERCWRTAVGGLTGGQRREGGDGEGGALLEDHGWRTDRWTGKGGRGEMEDEERCWRTTVGGLTGTQTDNRGRGDGGGALLEDRLEERCWRTVVGGPPCGTCWRLLGV